MLNLTEDSISHLQELDEVIYEVGMTRAWYNPLGSVDGDSHNGIPSDPNAIFLQKDYLTDEVPGRTPFPDRLSGINEACDPRLFLQVRREPNPK